MTNLDSILKSRDITLPTKVHLVKARVFPVVMYGCESWTMKKAECWSIDGFELWCWIRLRVPWTSRRSNQSILKEISPVCSLEGLVEAETPILWSPDVKSWLIGKDPDAGRDWGQEERGWLRMRWLDGIAISVDMSLSKLGVGNGQEGLACYSPWGSKESDTTELLNWTDSVPLIFVFIILMYCWIQFVNILLRIFAQCTYQWY